MSSHIKKPFSGDVSQVINPLQWWGEFLNGNSSTNSLISINNYKSSSHDTERRIVTEAAGYGMQLGRMMEVLELLLSLHENENFSDEQNRVIDHFLEISTQVKQIKEEELLKAFSIGNIHQMTEGLQQLKSNNPELFKEVSVKLRAILEP